ncbi:MAG: PAS domain-containing protein, partial [Bryobacteraceae bacterium]
MSRLLSPVSLPDVVEKLDAIIWEADPATGKFTFVSEGVRKILGCPPSRWVDDPAFWLSSVHPDDREAAKACFRGGDDGHTAEFRIRAADGRTVWLHNRIGTLRADGGGECRFGVMTDVTERKRLAAQQRAIAHFGQLAL